MKHKNDNMAKQNISADIARKQQVISVFVTEMIVAVVIGLFIQMSFSPFLKPYIFGFCSFLLPNVFFAWRSFKYSGAKYAREVTASFYVAEMGKFSLTLFLFVIGFKVALVQPNLEAKALTMLSTYLVSVLIHQILLFLRVKRQA